jgi:hypothetical protein
VREVETSILKSVKKNLGLELDYDVFDAEVSMHINSALSTLSQLGFGPNGGFAIESDEETWDQFSYGEVAELNQIKAYVYLKVRNLFDPPTTSYVMKAFSDQIQELETRLSMLREGREWVNPMAATDGSGCR